MLTILTIALLFTFYLYQRQNEWYRRLLEDLSAKNEKDRESLQAQLNAANHSIEELKKNLAKGEKEARTRTLVLSDSTQKSANLPVPVVHGKKTGALVPGDFWQ